MYEVGYISICWTQPRIEDSVMYCVLQDCEATSDTDSSDTIIYSPKETHTDTPIPPKAAAAASLVECPLCLAFYPHYAIEVHASLCSGEQDGQRTMASCGAPVFID